MECYYHPEREGTDKCAICGKSICKECGLEIAGKVYCKECLEKIIGLGVENGAQQQSQAVEEAPLATEPAKVDAHIEEATIYQPQDDEIDFEIPYSQPEEVPSNEFKGISDDSPYNIKNNIQYESSLESSYLEDTESIYQKPQDTPQIAQNEVDIREKQVLTPKANNDDFIYPDHDYEPQPTTARQELEDKYEKYLDDLYFDETDVPLEEQLAKDEEQYGSLTRRKYAPRKEEAAEQKKPGKKKAPKDETPEEMEARIRAEIMKEQGLLTGDEDKNIHNLDYGDEKEPMGILDILLSIILIIVILIVLYYLVYLFFLNANYPTFMDALFALKNPQNVINAILTR